MDVLGVASHFCGTEVIAYFSIMWHLILLPLPLPLLLAPHLILLPLPLLLALHLILLPLLLRLLLLLVSKH
jgi:hypothetical protein